MLFSFLCMVLRFVLRLAPVGEARDREAEILVLRHQIKVMRRQASRPKLSRLDKLFLAATSRILPRERWSSFVVTRRLCSVGIANWFGAGGPTRRHESAARASIPRCGSS
jgi:hypothetical protein